MKIKLYGLIVCICAMLILAVKMRRPQNQQELRIGFVCALTGSASGTGRPIANSVDFFRQKFPDAKFFVEDSKSTPVGGIQAAHKLIDVDRVQVIFCEMSNVSVAIADYSDRNKVIFIAPIILKDFVKKYKYTVRDFMTLDEQVKVDLLAYEQLRDEGGSNIVAIVSNDEFGRSSLDGLEVALNHSRLRLKADFRFEDDSERIKSVVVNVLKHNPDVIFASSFSPSLGVLIKELRTSGYAGFILTTTAFTAPSIQKAAGEGLWGIIHPDFKTTSTYAALESWYVGKFSERPPLTTFLCHDGIAVLMAAYRASIGAKSTVKIMDNLKNVVLSDGAYGNLRVDNREVKFQLTTKTIDRR